MKTDAYEAGKQARLKDEPRTKNREKRHPYPDGSMSGKYWKRGWDYENQNKKP